MNYSILLQWSEADRLYLVTIPEFAELVMQPCTHGSTYQEALANAQDCIETCLEYWQAEGITPPKPNILQMA
jgi:predicted RNase H-like HicB family nuclease